MVRHQEHLAAQPCAQAIDQCRLLCGLDIATEQQAVPALAMHAQHAAQRVGPRRRHVVTGQRMQQLEAHALPSPGLACGAAAVRRAAGQQRMRLGQRTGQSVHRHFVQQRRRPADMVDVAVAERQQVHAAFAARAAAAAARAARPPTRSNNAARRRTAAGGCGCAPVPPCPGRCRRRPPRTRPWPAAAVAAPVAAASRADRVRATAKAAA